MMPRWRITWVVAALLIMRTLAVAQEASAHEALSDAWWTGPLLAPSANTLPKGHMLVEPYLYDVTTQGFYDATGVKRSAPHANSYGSLTYINYGVSDRFTVGLIPTFGYNEVSNGPSSSGVGVGDLTAQAQYRLHSFREGSWIPTTSIAVQETLPSGKYDELGNRASNGLGGGAFTTTLALYTQTFFWMPNGRILRMRVNVAPAFSHALGIGGVSMYGTDEGFAGRAKPGNSIFVDTAWEYSLTQRWVLALDATYRNQANTHVAGFEKINPLQPVTLNSGSSRAFGVAPAIEYNLSNKVGIIFGTRLFPAARNTTATITPAIAINIVH